MRVVVPFKPDGTQPRCTVAVLDALGVPGVPEKHARTLWDMLKRLNDAKLKWTCVSLGARKPTVREFVREREGKPGRFYFFTAGHALALLDGDTLIDTTGRGLSDRIRVRGAFEILGSDPAPVCV